LGVLSTCKSRKGRKHFQIGNLDLKVKEGNRHYYFKKGKNIITMMKNTSEHFSCLDKCEGEEAQVSKIR
jgi:hypothetical protein